MNLRRHSSMAANLAVYVANAFRGHVVPSVLHPLKMLNRRGDRVESHGLDAPLPAAKREQGRLGPPHQTPPANFLDSVSNLPNGKPESKGPLLRQPNEVGPRRKAVRLLQARFLKKSPYRRGVC